MISISKPGIGSWEIAAATRVFQSGMLVQGPHVANFEELWKAEFGYRAVACSSGTAALTLLLRAHGIGPGYEVIIPSFSFFATAEAVVEVGATPVFADIDECYTLDPVSVENVLTTRTKAIIAVHLFGQPARMNELGSIAKKHRLLLLEDACQAHGAVYGNQNVGALYDGGAFSFYPSKNMTTMEGGMVVTQDPAVERELRLLRNHGLAGKPYEHERCAGNFKMTEVQAAIGIVQLGKLKEANGRRLENAIYYHQYMNARIPHAAAAPPCRRQGTGHAYNQFTIRVPGDKRDLLQKALLENGIETRIYYPKAIHEQPMFLNMVDSRDLPNTMRATKQVLSLPVHPGVTDEERTRIMQTLEALV